jgi:HNH endonuclease
MQQRLRRLSKRNRRGCWIYQGKLDRWGYGQIKVGSRRDGTRRSTKAHIVSYIAFVGPIPAGLTLDHTCNVRACVNPEHLVPMTMRENTLKPGSQAPTAINARKTHCAKGHPLSGENLRFRPDNGGRVCRTCQGWKG